MENLRKKLAILADAAKYDVSCSSSGSARKNLSKNGIGNTQASGICHSYTPDGRCISLLKILFTNQCIFDCSYCVNRSSNQIKRASFTVDEVVWLTMEFYRRNYIEGLFLSSGILTSSDETMEMLIEVARRLRTDELFNGYIHIKGVAGASPCLLSQAGRWADRISANAELPSQVSLDQFAPGKSHKNVNASFREVHNLVAAKKEKAHSGRADDRIRVGGQSTQIVVGPGNHTDHDILSFASDAYRVHNVNRVYYSAYTPVAGADVRLPQKQVPLVRENRLYQADWLLRHYGFEFEELLPKASQNLELDKDPKLSWALRNLDRFPLDVNRATREELLRVPGLGFKTVRQILAARRFRSLTTLHLKKIVHRWKLARLFLMTADYNREAGQFNELPGQKSQCSQLTLFDEAGEPCIANFS